MKLISALLLIVLSTAAFGQKYEPVPENLEAREWFQDAKFGLFIHWGVYSVLGEGEWVMNNKKIPVSEYDKLPAKFNPTKYDAAAWVRMAKDAGMKYITITSKHHDGFAMWGTKQSKWNIVDATPYKKDVLKALAEECRKQGIKLFFYHSQLDWHHTDYYPRGRTGNDTGRPESGDFNKYLDFMDAQLEELLTGYGPIAGIWFDGWWDRKDRDWRLDKTYSMIHRLQPAALIGSNHHVAPFDGEDFQMFEKDLPGHNTTGFSEDATIGQLPLESCNTISGAWGYNKNDKRYKSTKDLIHFLVRSAGYNANYLLNVGPTPEGEIQAEFQERLAAMGKWLRANGESIYGTRGGPITPRPWGATTQTASKVYLHILDWQDDLLAIPKIAGVTNARVLNSGAAVETTAMDDGMILQLPSGARDELDTIIVFDKK
jgi:alpha-L-fucosidase